MACGTDGGQDQLLFLGLDSDYESDGDEDPEQWSTVATDKFNEVLIELAIKIEEEKQDALDMDWIPDQERMNRLRMLQYKKGRYLISRYYISK